MLGASVVLLGTLSLTCCVNGWAFVSRWRPDESSEDVEISPWALRQRFLLDLMLQVHKPLLQQELIEMGHELNENPEDYETGTWPLLLEFMDAVHQQRILRPYGIYSQVQQELPHQLMGVYRFLVLAKNWKIFQRNACFARIHFHPVLFVNALQMAVDDREDCGDLRLPAMHEVLPQLYFDKEIILEAQLVYWQQLAPVPTISRKRSWRETVADILYPKSLRPWNSQQVEWMPTYPMVIQAKKSRTTLVSLDVELNGYWNRLISRLMIADQGSSIIDGDRLMALHDERDERRLSGNPTRPQNYLLLMHNIRQFTTLLQLEQLAQNGTSSLQFIESTLLTTGGVPYKASSGLNADAVLQLINESIEELRNHIDKELKDDHEMQTMCTVGRVIASRYWQLFRQLSLAINGDRLQPNLLGMATSNLRDPFYRVLLLQLAQLITGYEQRFVKKQPLHQHHKQQKQQLHLRHILVGHLETFDQLVDSDLINLMDQQLLQTQRNNLRLLRRRLVARHKRLNHKSFNISYHIFAPTPKKVLIKSYLLPTGNKNSPRLLLDSFVSSLTTGDNQFERHFATAPTLHTLSDLYEAKQPLDDGVSRDCSFPHHLLLPRGTAEGLKLQMLIEIHSWSTDEESSGCAWAASEEMDCTAHLLTSSQFDVVVYHKTIELLETDL
ncbi:fat-body protein 1 [Drosophila albomicans]|uniref:Fat-body protein 1 n=1 Tax=Drosophila albomicans TaxID=7291 RepID=A0A6P8X689_DROAB|nr:fat-body protein 1 [Drosophila albomicans]